jgi:hypothetical protein
MKKMDSQLLTPTKPRQITPKNPTMSARTLSKKKSCK